MPDPCRRRKCTISQRTAHTVIHSLEKQPAPAKTAFAKAVHGFSTKISTNKAACTYQTQPKSAYNFAIFNPINHHDTI